MQSRSSWKQEKTEDKPALTEESLAELLSAEEDED